MEKLELFLTRDWELTWDFCKNVSTIKFIWAHTAQIQEIKQSFKDICNGKKIHVQFLQCALEVHDKYARSRRLIPSFLPFFDLLLSLSHPQFSHHLRKVNSH